MKWPLNNGIKVLLVLAFLAVSIYGFMIKLPGAFRHYDKELHMLFYFMASAFLNILFAKRNVFVHLLIFGLLCLFGISIEFAQEYSNKFFHHRIHGRYDVEDVKANLKGLVTFSILWIVYISISFTSKKLVKEKVELGD